PGDHSLTSLPHRATTSGRQFRRDAGGRQGLPRKASTPLNSTAPDLPCKTRAAPACLVRKQEAAVLASELFGIRHAIASTPAGSGRAAFGSVTPADSLPLDSEARRRRTQGIDFAHVEGYDGFRETR